MTHQDRFMTVLTEWLDDQATLAPAEVLRSVIDDLPTTPQRARWKVPARRTSPAVPSVSRFATVFGAVALAVVLGVGMWGGLDPMTGPPTSTATPSGPAPTPTASHPTGSPSPLPSSAGEFTPTGSLRQGCAWCTAVLLDDGSVLVVGGWSIDEGGRRPPAELYDPVTGTFLAAGSPITDAGQGSAVRLMDGRVLLVGGLSERATIYDPGTGRFQATSLAYAQGDDRIGVALADGRVLILGGLTTATQIYDPATDDVTPTGSMTTQRGDVTATLLQDGSVLVVGSGTADIYDPATGRFSRTGLMSTPRGYATATALMDGRVLLVGGSEAADPYGDLASAELYDPRNGTFSATGAMHQARFWHASALLHDGRVLVVGGGSPPAASAEIYDPTTGEFTQVEGAMTQPRTAVTAVTLADGRVLVLGHYPGNTPASPGAQFPSDTAELFRP
jgi:hypothetical protein